MGTGTSRGGRGSARGGTGGGVRSDGRTDSVRGGGGPGGRSTDDLFSEWLRNWINSLPPPEELEEEDVDESPVPEGGEDAAAGAGGSGIPTNRGNSSGEHPPAPRISSLKVTDVDLNRNSNGSMHHTDEYENDESIGVILRRGQEFQIDLHLNRPFKPKRERLFLQFTVASVKTPRPMDGTLIDLDIEGTYKEGSWSAKLESAEGNSIKVMVNSAPNAIVGTYKFFVKVESRASRIERLFPQDKNIIVLFNPWCEKDTVYMENRAEREEYVMADTGAIWRGSAFSNRSTAWTFGQFDIDVYRVVLELMEEEIRLPQDRESAARVSRWFTNIIYAKVLLGNWSGNYEGGTRPTRWTGSVRIIEEYGNTKEPVKYGQCWVFSGLLTTFLRCVGIPTRSVTNFDSAHDTERNKTIDEYVDSKGKSLKDEFFYGRSGNDGERTGRDSIWNFHVWNESWMTRKDLHGLDEDFDGWQVVDSTPQEMSGGIYQCGPAPVKAIKRGIVDIPYDSGFVFAEVNADEARWLVTPYRTHRHSLIYTLLSRHRNTVGKKISTLKVGSDPDLRYAERNDVTLDYKYSEGSPEERAAVERAVSMGINRGLYDADDKPELVSLAIECKDDLWIGKSASVQVETKNEFEYPKEIELDIEIRSILYTGLPKDIIKKDEMKYIVNDKESISQSIHLTYEEDYGDKLDDEGMFQVRAIATVKGSKTPVICKEIFRFKQPDLEVKGDVNGKEVKLTVKFKNPLNKRLTGCTFTVEAPKLVRPFSVNTEDIEPNEMIEREIRFPSRSSGRKTVIVELDTNLIKDVTGSVKVEV
ncbi:protein-glutamine gamma-glutamyltransferase 4-like [Lytechinus pictus]|uniref:protein-glutamine gamma-glutamyltransferase 4-like n=1 Tax=Lytechinus pictus TaxID=7653 RepID=UPI0030B9D75D